MRSWFRKYILMLFINMLSISSGRGRYGVGHVLIGSGVVVPCVQIGEVGNLEPIGGR